MRLHSDSFEHRQPLAAEFALGARAGFGGNRNPHLVWDDVPAGTRSFVLLCIDPDAPTDPALVADTATPIPVEHPRGDFVHWVVADIPAEGSRQANVFAHRLGGQQIEMLKDHADLAAQCHQTVFVQLRRIHAMDAHAALVRQFQRVDRAQQRGLACAAATDDAEDLAPAHIEAHRRQRMHLARIAVEGLADALENDVLRDNNLNVIKHSPEFLSNKSPDTPTNRLCTSLFSRERLGFLLRFALVYVNESDGLQKHVMRYPQLFATKAIEKKLDAGVKKGIIWHTQGSGKTALAYYNTRFLTDYFQRKGVIPKFYFIVDRLDLLIQAQREFAGRGLVVHTIDSREAFARDIKTTQVLHNHSGKPEITVVNIQKFQDDPDVVRAEDYDFSIQRVYFLDEVHRSYNPQGSFLANLSQSDRNAIKIGLTGTPLLGDDYNSRALFGDYIHKYYYNASIADGYTLRLIREEIATNYKISLQEALAAVTLQQGDIDRKLIYSHPKFVEPMLDYIVRDFEKSRSALGDAGIGGMVICDSAEQAREMFRIFTAVYAALPSPAHTAQDAGQTLIAAAQPGGYAARTLLENRVKNAALILHDVGSKQERKDWVQDFKDGKIDLLFVYNMLLTGFDAKRLKKLYLGRIIKAHNLL